MLKCKACSAANDDADDGNNNNDHGDSDHVYPGQLVYKNITKKFSSGNKFLFLRPFIARA